MNLEKIRMIAEKYQKSTSAPLAFGFKDLKSGETVTFHADESFPTASAYKMYILAELYRKAAKGECDLSERIPLTEAHKSCGSGVLAELGAGIAPTLKDYALLMMTISDNTATNVLFRYVTRDGIRANVLEPLGLSRTKCDFDCTDLLDKFYGMGGLGYAEFVRSLNGVVPSFRDNDYFACRTEQSNCTSPLDAMKMLETLYRGQWVDEKTSEQVLDVMLRCQTNSRIPKYLPEFKTRVAHKTGTMDRLCVDVGIVYTEKGDYLLTMFYNGNCAEEAEYNRNEFGYEGDVCLANLSREIYYAYMED